MVLWLHKENFKGTEKFESMITRIKDSMERVTDLWLDIELSTDDVKIDWSIGGSVYSSTSGNVDLSIGDCQICSYN